MSTHELEMKCRELRQLRRGVNRPRPFIVY